MRLARCAWPGAKIAPMRRATPSGSPHALNRVLPVFFLPTNLRSIFGSCAADMRWLQTRVLRKTPRFLPLYELIHSSNFHRVFLSSFFLSGFYYF